MLALIVLLLYFSGLLAFGLRSARKVSSQRDFTLAGGKLGPLVLTGTLLATWTGTGSIFGNAEQAWTAGLPALILPLSAAAGLLVLLFIIGPVRKLGSFTLQDVLEQRFGPVARVLGTLTLVTAYLVIVSYQLRAASAVLERVLEGALLEAGFVNASFPPEVFLIGMAVVIGVYTALAGLMSVAFTDGFNGILMVTGLLIALPLAWSAASGGDGIAGVLAALPESGRHLTGHYSGFQVLGYLLPPFLLVIGDANLHQRFLAARDTGAARKALLILIPAVVLVDTVIILTAVAGRALYPELDNPGHVLLELALSGLPPVLGALLVAAILAIVVSTADSFLLSSSSALVRDVYQRFIAPEASEARLLVCARLGVLVLTAVALVLAFASDRFFAVSLLAYSIYGVGITPVLLAALFWKRATPAGAVASMLAGGTFTALWELRGWGAEAARSLGQPEGADVGSAIPGILVAGACLIGVSLVTKPREATHP